MEVIRRSGAGSSCLLVWLACAAAGSASSQPPSSARCEGGPYGTACGVSSADVAPDVTTSNSRERNHTRSLGGLWLLAGLSGLRRSGWLSRIRLRVGPAGTRGLAGLAGLRHASGLSGILRCLGSHLGSLIVGMAAAVDTCHTRPGGTQPVATSSSNGI
jgi:hypothetical protein